MSQPAEPVRGEAGVASLVPFGAGRDKPRDYLAAWRAFRENSDSLGLSWNILKYGVCDSCSIGSRGLADDGAPGLHLCVKRLAGLRDHTMPALAPIDVLDIGRLRELEPRALGRLGRVPTPMVYRAGSRGFDPVDWETAFELLAPSLRQADPRKMAFVAHGARSNEAFYALARTARLLGCNNTDLVERPMHDVLAELEAHLGTGAATCSLFDLAAADLIVVVGAGFGATHPALARYLATAKQQRGARVVCLMEPGAQPPSGHWNPTAPLSALFGTPIVDDAIPLATDGAAHFLQGVLKGLLDRDATADAWLSERTAGWEDVALRVREGSWEELEDRSQGRRAQMEWVANLAHRAGNVVVVLASADPMAAQAAVALQLAQGMLGKPGCGIVPLTGIGELGSRDCGLVPDAHPGGRSLSKTKALRDHWGDHPLSRWKGASADNLPGDLALLYAMGPGPRVDDVPVRVHQVTGLDPACLAEPGELTVILPEQSIYEEIGGVTLTSVERRVRFSPQIARYAVGEARSAWRIPMQLASVARPELAGSMSIPDVFALRQEMSACIPHFQGLDGLERPGDSLQWGGARLHVGEFDQMADGKAIFPVAWLE